KQLQKVWSVISTYKSWPIPPTDSTFAPKEKFFCSPISSVFLGKQHWNSIRTLLSCSKHLHRDFHLSESSRLHIWQNSAPQRYKEWPHDSADTTSQQCQPGSQGSFM